MYVYVVDGTVAHVHAQDDAGDESAEYVLCGLRDVSSRVAVIGCCVTRTVCWLLVGMRRPWLCFSRHFSVRLVLFP